MKILNKTLLLTTATLALAFTVNAHDPSMHAKKAPAKADCSGYLKMVESGTKMDMSDPVMMAMMKKCKNKQAEHDNADGHHDAKKGESKCGDKNDGHHDKKAESKCGDMSDGHHDKKADKKCGDMKKGESKCGDKKAVVEKVKGKMKCGGDMKNAAKKVEKKVEEHGKHDH